MKRTRREFVGDLGKWGAAAWLGDLFPRLALGSSPMLPGQEKDHFFVTMNAVGGMDCTLGLDPWVLPPGADAEDLFLEYRPEDILQAEGIKLGPSAKALAPFAKDCLTVNGIMMRRDAGHPACITYMSTGRGDGKAGDLAAELAMATGTGPFGLVTNTQVYLAGKALSLSATSDILTELEEGDIIAVIEERLKLLAQSAGTPLEESAKQIVAGKDATARLIGWIKKLKEQAGGKLEDRHVLAAALLSGSAWHGQLMLPIVNLDTHSNHEKVHVEQQKQTWDKVAELFQLFKSLPYRSGSLFEHTTFLVTTEFSRTPALNAAKGKDHNAFTNSCLFAGKGIRGGTTVGASRLITRKQTGTGMSDHIAWPLDYKTGKLATGPQGASFIFPENVARTVAKIFGDPAGFSSVAPTVPVIPGVTTGN